MDNFTTSQLKVLLVKFNVSGRSKCKTKLQMFDRLQEFANAHSKKKKSPVSRRKSATSSKKTKSPSLKKKVHKSMPSVKIVKHGAHEHMENDFIVSNLNIKSNVESTALKQLRKEAQKYPETKYCTGAYDDARWFEYLQRWNHLDVDVLPELMLDYDFKTGLTLDPDYKHLIKAIRTQIQERSQFGNFVLPIGFHGFQDDNRNIGHANLALINTVRKRIEFFEPHGAIPKFERERIQCDMKKSDIRTTYLQFEHAKLLMHDYLANELPKLLNLPAAYEFETPYEESGCPLGPQLKTAHDKKCPRGGFCITFSQIFAHLRCLAPKDSPKLTLNAWKQLNGDEALEFVKRYCGWQNSIGLLEQDQVDEDLLDKYFPVTE